MLVIYALTSRSNAWENDAHCRDLVKSALTRALFRLIGPVGLLDHVDINSSPLACRPVIISAARDYPFNLCC